MFPIAAGVGRSGDVYVTDETLTTVTRYSTAPPAFLTEWGGRHGIAPGSLFNPQGVSVDSQGRVWVIDLGNHRGQVFSASGRYLFTFLDHRVGLVDNRLAVAPEELPAGRPLPWILVAALLMVVGVLMRDMLQALGNGWRRWWRSRR